MLWACRGGLCNWDMGMGAWHMRTTQDASSPIYVATRRDGCGEYQPLDYLVCHPFMAGFWKEKIKWELKNEAQAEAAVAAGRRVAAPKRHTTAPGAVAPAAPTKHAVNAIERAFRVGLGRTDVITIPVLAPFIHIATHIVDPQTVRGLGGNIVSFITTVVSIPSHSIDIIASRIFGTAAMSTSGGIFPFRLGGQPEVLACFRIQTGDEGLAVVP